MHILGVCQHTAYMAEAILVCDVLLNLQSTLLGDRFMGTTSGPAPTSHGTLYTMEVQAIQHGPSYLNSGV